MSRAVIVGAVVAAVLLVAAWRAPVIDCPLGPGGGAHFCCDECRSTNKLTVVQSGRLLVMNRGHWPTWPSRAGHLWRL